MIVVSEFAFYVCYLMSIRLCCRDCVAIAMFFWVEKINPASISLSCVCDCYASISRWRQHGTPVNPMCLPSNLISRLNRATADEMLDLDFNSDNRKLKPKLGAHVDHSSPAPREVSFSTWIRLCSAFHHSASISLNHLRPMVLAALFSFHFCK